MGTTEYSGTREKYYTKKKAGPLGKAKRRSSSKQEKE
jgi:hypothetical protein